MCKGGVLCGPTKEGEDHVGCGDHHALVGPFGLTTPNVPSVLPAGFEPATDPVYKTGALAAELREGEKSQRMPSDIISSSFRVAGFESIQDRVHHGASPVLSRCSVPAGSETTRLVERRTFVLIDSTRKIRFRKAVSARSRKP